MEWVRIIVVLVLLGRAIYTDVKRGIIENRIIWLGLIMAGIWSYCNGGINGLLQSGKMVVLTFGVLFVFYLVRGLGAGDVKLLCVLSAFFPELLWNIAVASFVMAAVISVGKMMIRGIRRKNIYVPGETILFSVPVGIGTGLVLLQQYVR